MKELSRRNFLRNTALAVGSVSLTPKVFASGSPNELAGTPNEPMESRRIWGSLIHLSYNMWCDRLPEKWGKTYTHDQMHYVKVSDNLRFDNKLWYDITDQMAKAGMNMVVMDIGDGIQYASHPEISVKNAWTTQRLVEELARLRSIGLEPIPKLNFSTAHDEWLHQYARMVSTPAYYKVCSDLITEVAALFSKPRFFHIGYDEETAGNQSAYALSIVRQHELWWHDFNFIVDTVQAQGCRPWMWSDYEWEHPEDFYIKMPKNILQSNWYYGLEFNKPESKRLKSFLELEKHGYNQIPTGSNWNSPESFGKLVEWCYKEIPGPQLKGFLQTPWFPTLEPFRERHFQAVANVAAAIRASKLQSS